MSPIDFAGLMQGLGRGLANNVPWLGVMTPGSAAQEFANSTPAQQQATLSGQAYGGDNFQFTPITRTQFYGQQPQQAPMPEERVRRVRQPTQGGQYVQDYTPEEYTNAWRQGMQVTPQGVAFGGGGGGGGGQMTYPDAVRRNRAMEAADAQARNRNNAQPFVPQNALEYAAAMQGRADSMSPFSLLASNQLGSFLNYGNQLNQAYNSPTGPYGQLQLAAAATAPARASRDVAKTDANASIIRSLIEGDTARDVADLRFSPQREIAEKILGALGGGGVSPFQLAQEDRKGERKGSLRKYKANK